ncbi:MAG: PIN domain-containing protein [Bacillota bacterium]
MGKLAAILKAYRTVALDTAVFIYHFEKNEKYSVITEEIFSRLDKDKDFTAVTSVITVLEVCVKPIKESRQDLVTEYTQKLLYDDKLATWVVDGNIVQKAAEIRAKYGIKTPDAIQIATAITAEADVFITNDTALKKVEEIEVLVLKELAAPVEEANTPPNAEP